MPFSEYNAMTETNGLALINEGLLSQFKTNWLLGKSLDEILVEYQKVTDILKEIETAMDNANKDTSGNHENILKELRRGVLEMQQCLQEANNRLTGYFKDTVLNCVQCLGFFASPISTGRILRHSWLLTGSLISKDLYTYVHLIELSLLKYYVALRLNDTDNMNLQYERYMRDTQNYLDKIQNIVLQAEKEKTINSKNAISNITRIFGDIEKRGYKRNSDHAKLYDKQVSEYASAIDQNITELGKKAFEDQIEKEKSIISKLGNIDKDDEDMIRFSELMTETCEITAAKFRQKLAILFRNILTPLQTDKAMIKSVDDIIDESKEKSKSSTEETLIKLKDTLEEREKKGKELIKDVNKITLDDLYDFEYSDLRNVLSYLISADGRADDKVKSNDRLYYLLNTDKLRDAVNLIAFDAETMEGDEYESGEHFAKHIIVKMDEYGQKMVFGSPSNSIDKFSEDKFNEYIEMLCYSIWIVLKVSTRDSKDLRLFDLGEVHEYLDATSTAIKNKSGHTYTKLSDIEGSDNTALSPSLFVRTLKKEFAENKDENVSLVKSWKRMFNNNFPKKKISYISNTNIKK